MQSLSVLVYCYMGRHVLLVVLTFDGNAVFLFFCLMIGSISNAGLPCNNIYSGGLTL